MRAGNSSRPVGTYFNAAYTIVSGFIWVAVWLLNKYLFSFTHLVPGISLIFIPAGFRLLIILVFGFWGSLGIFLFEPLLYFNEFQSGSVIDVLATSAISAFSPLLITNAFWRVVGARETLTTLKPWHLPVLALALSLFTPLLFNLLFAVTGKHPWSEFGRNYTGMVAGDFLGCVIVVGVIRLAVWSLRTIRRTA